MKKGLLLLSFLGCSVSLFAQSFCADSIKVQFLRDWTRAKAYTLDYLNTMPTDKYSLKATDSVRSFAQQMLHLAEANYNLISFATGAKGAALGKDLESRAGAQTKDSVVYYVSASYDFALQSIQGLDGSKYGETVGGGRFSGTRYAILLKAFEHQTHHRGQTTVYIRLAGVKPPNERLF